MIFSFCRHRRTGRTWSNVPLLGALLISGVLAGSAPADEPTFEQVLAARRTTVLLEQGGKVLRGLNGGGIIVWDREDPLATERWTSGPDLSGNFITDMAWTGQNVWVATLGAGMTRVTNVDTAPEFRQYNNNLGSPDITAVTGTVIGDGERVFYGMAGKGLGQINSGISGNIYTVDDGLISNDITALRIFRGDLFVGTRVGISRFANNAFSDQNAGLTSLVINDLILDGDDNLLAASNAGIHQWDPDGETWFLLGTIGAPVMELASSAGKVYALGFTANLSEYDGSTWSSITLPFPQCTAIDAGEELWIGGPFESVTAGGKLTHNYLGRRIAGDEFDKTVDIATQVANCNGVAFGADGTAWMGDRDGFNISRYDARDNSYFFIYERPHAANDTLNLFPGLGPVESIVGARDGKIYASQFFGGGVLKFDPATGTTDLMDPDNSGLQGRNIVNLVIHPDGPLIVLHDSFDAQRVEVLVDPENWMGTTNWVLPPMDQGLDTGTSIWDALVERPDIIWFAVEEKGIGIGGGLVRWDVNGPDAGPNDPLTWFDPSDDVWYEPVTSFEGTILRPGQTKGLALGHDGYLWAGGSGLVQFTYNLGPGTAIEDSVEVLLALQEKVSPTAPGLVNNSVSDIAVDGNGDVWVATATGINRVSRHGNDTLVSAWIDLPNYLVNTNGILYAPDVVAPLPGNTYAKISPSHDGRRMLLSSDQGTTIITVGSGPGSGQGTDPLKDVFCYPNPWTPDGPTGRLKIGGLPVETVSVDVYNISGQLVFTDKSVAEDIGFWEGDNIAGNRVASGMYVLKIATAGQVTTRVLAVVR